MDATPAIAAYEAALPDDPAIRRKRMFGQPCAFVDRQMFFGTFGDSVVARVGPERVSALAGQPGMRVFTPTEGRAWEDYVQVDVPADPGALAGLATEALAWTRKLPPRVKGRRSASRG
jgi:hypothetical protein